MRSRLNAGILAALVTIAAGLGAQERGPEALSADAIQASIDALGNLEFEIRQKASRAIRRAPPESVTPALIRAVESHKDPFVRFRALVLLTSFNDSRTPGLVREMASNANDRLRTVAYTYFEHHPSPGVVPDLLDALSREESEFVRPALVRALAAHGSDERVRKALLAEVNRGQDYFRSAVIEALGDYRATYALEALMAIARMNGPLQVDAVIALGELKEARAMDVLAALQRSAPQASQPPIAAAICLLGINCDTHLSYLSETLKFADVNQGHQELLRNTVTGLVALANGGEMRALAALFDVAVTAVDPPRAPMALGIATVALRNTPAMLTYLEALEKPDAAIELIAEGFDMLEEDYEEERFFATVRRRYWAAAEGSRSRTIGEALIENLQF